MFSRLRWLRHMRPSAISAALAEGSPRMVMARIRAHDTPGATKAYRESGPPRGEKT